MNNEAKLSLLFWEVTKKCNLACIHCRMPEEVQPLNELNTENSYNLIDTLAGFSPNTILVFSGGEPLCRQDIFELLAYANSKNLKVALSTNGTLITQQIAIRIKQAGVQRVSISLDGATSKTHDNFRKIDGSFEMALAGFRYLKAVNMPVQINTTITKHNLSELEDILNLAVELEVCAVHIFMLVPVGCGVQIEAKQMLSPSEYETVLNWLYEQSKKVIFQIKPTCAPHYFRIICQKEGKFSNIPPSHGLNTMSKGCLSGSRVCFVSSQGNVYPCGYLPVSAGNILQTGLNEIWQDSNIFHQLRDADLLKGKCGRCEYKLVCSGCRARAYAKTGDYLDQEPYCNYTPKTL